MSSTTYSRGFRHILCPVDFSRHSRVALRYASALAERAGGKLSVLTANDPMLAAAAAAAMTRDVYQLDTLTMRELRQFVYKVLGPLGAKATLDVVVGHPADQIDRAARQLGVDLIVMGTHGLSGPKKWFFGSTTESLFRRLKVPVLAVPGRGRAFARRSVNSLFKTVLAPVDLQGTDPNEIKQVSDTAKRLGGKPLFLHVVRPADVPTWLNRQRIEAAQSKLRELLGESMKPGFRIVLGDPADQIERTARRERTGAIVMTLKRHGLLGPRRGSIAYRVVTSGVAPVLALPSPRERLQR
jgi:nucleotide-binding universal stress UspA family protein